jgi:iron complex outermembrane recepter protein
VEFRTSFSLSEQEEGEEDETDLDEEVEQEIHTRALGSTLILRHAPAGPFADGALGLNVRFQNQEIEGIEAYHPGQRLLSLAGFLFEEIPLTPRVRLQFGGRVENEATRTLPNLLFPEEATTESTALNLAGSIGMNLRPTEPLEIGMQLARAHRNPTVVERFASGWDVGAARVEIGDPTLRSEIGHGVDLFGRFASDRLRVELAGFAYWIDDYVALRYLPAGCGGIEFRVRPDRDFPVCVQYHSADAEMLGGEALFEALLTPTLRARATLDHVRGTRTDGPREPLAFIPPTRAMFGILHDAGNWFAGATSRWVAAQDRVPEDELPTAGYTLLNFEGGLRLLSTGRHLLTLRLDNALDTSYAEHLSVIRRFPDPVSPDNPVRFEMPGRNLNVGYRYVF